MAKTFEENLKAHNEKLNGFIKDLEVLLEKYGANFVEDVDIDYDGNSVTRLCVDFNDHFSPEDMIYDVATEIYTTK